MSPLDDHLRDALHARADVLAPSPDPLAGIERRARGMRRRKAAASVTGAALAVAAIALAVPALQPADPEPAPFASSSPTALATGYALDPAAPWAFRGTHDAAFESAAVAKYRVAHPNAQVSLLYGQAYEPSASRDLVFVATTSSGPHYGVALGTADGLDLLYDTPLRTGTDVLSLTLPGDEQARLLVLASPEVRSFEVDTDAAGPLPFTAMTSLAPGVAIAPSVGSTLRVTAPDGTVLYEGDESSVDPQPTPTPAPGGAPSNLLDWPTRGAGESDLVAKLQGVYAPTLQTTADEVAYKVLFAGDTDSGVRYVMGQVWKTGAASAHAFAYAEGGTNGPSVFFGQETDPKATVLAFLVDSLPGTSVDLAVVIPAPRTTQVLYDDDDQGAYRPAAEAPGLDGVVLIDRSKTADSDRLQVLTGNGDPATDVTYDGPLRELLCGSKECD